MTIQMVVEFHEDTFDGQVTVHTCCGASVQSNDLQYALRVAHELVTKLHAERAAAAVSAEEALAKAATKH